MTDRPPPPVRLLPVLLLPIHLGLAIHKTTACASWAAVSTVCEVTSLRSGKGSGTYGLLLYAACPLSRVLLWEWERVHKM